MPFDVESSVLLWIALLVSFARLVRVFFAAIRTCVREYYAFREWFAGLPAHQADSSERQLRAPQCEHACRREEIDRCA
jgi:hypothetical protein